MVSVSWVGVLKFIIPSYYCREGTCVSSLINTIVEWSFLFPRALPLVLLDGQGNPSTQFESDVTSFW